MNIPKLFALFALILFGIIGTVAFMKREKSEQYETVIIPISAAVSDPVDIKLEHEVRSVEAGKKEFTENLTPIIAVNEEIQAPKVSREEQPPEADRIEELFRKIPPKLPIVETITYKSKVDWLKGRPAWISDYAGHYKTSRHFIARSLNGKRDYFKQNVALGDRFNVFKPDIDITFYLVIDTGRSKMWFYYYDKEANEKVLLKTYDVGLGRVDNSQASGLLTPLGHYKLGEKVAIYKSDKMGLYNGEKTEMIRIFGTRWMPFEEEIADCTAPAKGFGIHGAPRVDNGRGEKIEDAGCIGKYESDGCIRLRSDDVEELFSIVISRPTHVILVKDFFEANVPGNVKG